MLLSVIVGDLDLLRSNLRPAKTDPPLVVDPDAVLPRPVTAQFFQTITWWNTEVVQALRRIKDQELPKGHTLEVSVELPNSLSAPDPLSVTVLEGLQHSPIVTLLVINVKRYVQLSRGSVTGTCRYPWAVTRVDLVIFDCDGVLVDSERLAVRTEAEILTSLGWPITQAEIIERFVGRSAAYMQQEIERELGRRIDWETEFESRYRKVFERELVVVPGIVEALDEIRIPSCVASSGSHDKMRFTLGKTGLFDRFDGKIFSADQVMHGKPAPDVFLFAAAQMGVKPDRCAVVEDSVAGVTAALSAGMSAFAFAGGVTSAEALSIQNAVVFHNMADLPALLQSH